MQRPNRRLALHAKLCGLHGHAAICLFVGFTLAASFMWASPLGHTLYINSIGTQKGNAHNNRISVISVWSMWVMLRSTCLKTPLYSWWSRVMTINNAPEIYSGSDYDMLQSYHVESSSFYWCGLYAKMVIEGSPHPNRPRVWAPGPSGLSPSP
jgi:hypothetical protein